jgi:PilZ domain
VPYETLEEVGPTIPQTVNRRRSEREERRVPAWLSDASGSQSPASQQQVLVTNLSLHGVGFTATKRVAKDDAHWIVIASDRLSLSTRLRVVSVRENPTGGFDVGAEFF